jgi:hypothetical protein
MQLIDIRSISRRKCGEEGEPKEKIDLTNLLRQVGKHWLLHCIYYINAS